MKFEDSPFFELINHEVVKFNFGTYYFCKHFIVGELNEGVHFDKQKAISIGKKVIKHYGERPRVCLIANRLNSYSVDPQTWVGIMDMYPEILRASCIISYTELTKFNANLENRFFSEHIFRCNNLAEAINWTQKQEG